MPSADEIMRQLNNLPKGGGPAQSGPQPGNVPAGFRRQQQQRSKRGKNR
jgi:hypothetical protein